MDIIGDVRVIEGGDDLVTDDGNGLIASDSVSGSDIDDLKKEIEHLKKLHDYDYASKCVLDELNKEYDSMIRTDIWYEAAKEYLSKNINTYKFDNLLFSFRNNYSIWGDSLMCGIVYSNSYGGTYSSVIEFDVRDGADNNKISIKELHNAYPDVKLEDKFKQFCIEYKRKNEII